MLSLDQISKKPLLDVHYEPRPRGEEYNFCLMVTTHQQQTLEILPLRREIYSQLVVISILERLVIILLKKKRGQATKFNHLDFFLFFTLQFKANENINGKNVSLHGTKAHYIRIHPVTYEGTSACMRIALYGCDTGKHLLF